MSNPNVSVTVSGVVDSETQTVVITWTEFRSHFEHRMSDEELEAFRAGDLVTLWLNVGDRDCRVAVEVTTAKLTGSSFVALLADTRTIRARVRALGVEAKAAGDEIVADYCADALDGKILPVEAVDALLGSLRVPAKAFWQHAASGDKVPMGLREFARSAKAVL